MTDDAPIAYTALPKGAAVLAADGSTIGTVEHVLSDSSLDLFDGIAVKVGSSARFVDAGQVTAITRTAVSTNIPAADVSALPAPDGDPVLEADPHEFEGDGLSAWWGRMFMREHWKRDRHWDRE